MSSDSVITALGFGKAADRAYHQVVGQSGRELVSIAQSVLRTPEELMRDLAPLVERGIAQVEDSRLFVLTPAEAVVRMVEISADAAAAAHARLEAVGRALPHLTASNVRPADGDVESVFTRDELLTNIMIYWVTQTATSSARLYYESRNASTSRPMAAARRAISVSSRPAHSTNAAE